MSTPFRILFSLACMPFVMTAVMLLPAAVVWLILSAVGVASLSAGGYVTVLLTMAGLASVPVGLGVIRTGLLEASIEQRGS